ncbi:MAG: hypothetical protein KAI72_06480, partial [Candidatus Pacebacteria bacterium]|nr:hypothetical protein [Candidatus Paceibacterota bacterium]
PGDEWSGTKPAKCWRSEDFFGITWCMRARYWTGEHTKREIYKELKIRLCQRSEALGFSPGSGFTPP